MVGGVEERCGVVALVYGLWVDAGWDGWVYLFSHGYARACRRRVGQEGWSEHSCGYMAVVQVLVSLCPENPALSLVSGPGESRRWLYHDMVYASEGFRSDVIDDCCSA